MTIVSLFPSTVTVTLATPGESAVTRCAAMYPGGNTSKATFWPLIIQATRRLGMVLPTASLTVAVSVTASPTLKVSGAPDNPTEPASGSGGGKEPWGDQAGLYPFPRGWIPVPSAFITFRPYNSKTMDRLSHDHAGVRP